MIYKLSNYNNFVKYNEKIICFNSLSGALFTINNEQFNLFKKYKQNHKKLANSNKILYKLLIKTRFLISKELDELQLIRFRNRRDVFINNSYNLIINPTLDCNFKCWYCYESHPKGRMSEDILKRVEKHIKNLVESNKISKLNLSWFGGEPLLCFYEIIYKLSKILENIMSKNNLSFSNFITTNGYLINESIIDKFSKIKLKEFQITLDGNKDRHNKNRNINGKPTFKKIIKNIIMLCDKLNDINIYLRINYDNETLEDIIEILDCFPKKYRKMIKIDFQRIWQTYDKGISFNERLTKIVTLCENKGFRTSSAHFSLYKGYKCYADRWHQAVINYNGNVYKCTARDFNKKNRCGYLEKDGKIKWNAQKIIKRFSKSTFNNNMCINCKLLPLCLGPCSQKIIETKNGDLKTICHLNLLETSVKDFVINRYKQLVRKKEKDKN